MFNNSTPREELCNGTFCQLVKDFEVPPEHDLRRRFTDLLIANGAQSIDGKGGIAIGTSDEVLSRNSCPFCRFVQGAFKLTPGLLDHAARTGDEIYVMQVSAPIQGPAQDEFLWLRVTTSNTTEEVSRGSLMLPGEQVVLVTHSKEGGSRTGRLVGPAPDYERIKYWLHLCDTNRLHQGVCTGPGVVKSGGRASLTSLRVIDVLDMCLLEIGLQERYVTLSYVWGGANPPKLLRSQAAAYSRSGSLRLLLPEMPNTIQDAFTFTRKLGLRYLWFDSLCLIQDDPEDLLKGIMNMELVYESSYVTLIAADTKSADSGIPGIGALPREARQDRQLLKPGLEIMRVHSVDRHLKKSVWNTRGWTLQEYYLSRRTITFVNNQAYFRCRQKTWYEELWTDVEPDLPRGPDVDVIIYARDNMDLGIRNVATYTFLFQVLEVYQTRDLTDENDVLNAVAGVLRRVAASAKTEMVQGLPAAIFPLAILFLHTDRRAARRRRRFPSWSWCGWKGQCSWYPFDRLDLMNSADEDNDFNEDKALEVTLSHSWVKYHTTDGALESEMIWAPTLQQDALDAFSALPAIADTDLKFDRADAESKTLPNLKERWTRDYPLLTFRTITLHYRLKTIPEGGDDDDYDLDAERPSFKEYASRTYEISGREDEDCGVLYADKKLLLEEENVIKLVVLGECRKIEFPLEFDPYCKSTAEEPTFWVMMIRLIDGVWERRGIGQLLQTSLADSFPPGPRWEQVVLG